MAASTLAALCGATNAASLPSLATNSGSMPSSSQAARTGSLTGMAARLGLHADAAPPPRSPPAWRPARRGWGRAARESRPPPSSPPPAGAARPCRIGWRPRTPTLALRHHRHAMVADRSAQQDAVARAARCRAEIFTPAATNPTPAVVTNMLVGRAARHHLGIAGDDRDARRARGFGHGSHDAPADRPSGNLLR